MLIMDSVFKCFFRRNVNNSLLASKRKILKAIPLSGIGILMLVLSACMSTENTSSATPPSTGEMKPSHVSIQRHQGRHEVFVNGQLFPLKGVGINYVDGHNYRALAEAGGNAFRTWSTEYATEDLAAAKELGLMVAMGIDLQKELHGFDYTDKQAVKAQFDSAIQQVEQFKDHPNLLFWVVGNELNLLLDESGQLLDVNPAAYDALNDLVRAIQAIDPNHPVTTTFAGAQPSHLQTALERAPTLDFVSIQVYGGLSDVPEMIQASGVKKPFVVTEFGPSGHWERPATAWGREIEEPDGEKARVFAQRMQQGLLEDPTGQLLGGFAFEWGQKQERTPTWYGMFHKSGEATARIDELTKFWTGAYPENRAPLVHDIRLNGQASTANLQLNAGQGYEAQVEIQSPDGDVLHHEWQLMTEVKEKSQGGALELEPETLPVDVEVLTVSAELEKAYRDKMPTHLKVRFNAPKTEGEYRLFYYGRDGKGKATSANFPFQVIE